MIRQSSFHARTTIWPGFAIVLGSCHQVVPKVIRVSFASSAGTRVEDHHHTSLRIPPALSAATVDPGGRSRDRDRDHRAQPAWFDGDPGQRRIRLPVQSRTEHGWPRRSLHGHRRQLRHRHGRALRVASVHGHNDEVRRDGRADRCGWGYLRHHPRDFGSAGHNRPAM